MTKSCNVIGESVSETVYFWHYTIYNKWLRLYTDNWWSKEIPQVQQLTHPVNTLSQKLCDGVCPGRWDPLAATWAPCYNTTLMFRCMFVYISHNVFFYQPRFKTSSSKGKKWSHSWKVQNCRIKMRALQCTAVEWTGESVWFQAPLVIGVNAACWIGRLWEGSLWGTIYTFCCLMITNKCPFENVLAQSIKAGILNSIEMCES